MNKSPEIVWHTFQQLAASLVEKIDQNHKKSAFYVDKLNEIIAEYAKYVIKNANSTGLWDW